VPDFWLTKFGGDFSAQYFFSGFSADKNSAGHPAIGG
jgi:hypothetical protein